MNREKFALRKLVGAALACSVLVSGCSREPAAMGEGPPALPVQVKPIDSGTIQDDSEFVGALEAEEKVALRPEAEGRVVAVYVAPGQTVARGTPIVQLRAEQSRAQVGSAIADVAAAQAARSTAEARLRAALANRDRANSDVQLQNREFQRTQALVAEGALSRQSLEQARNQRDTAIATQRASQEEARAAAAALDEANATLNRTRAQQNVATADLSERRVVAPIAGIVGNIPVKVGDFVQTSTTLTNIIQNGALELNLSIPAERAPELREGLPVELLDAQSKPIGRGNISFISPEVDTAQQSILAKARFPNSGNLRDGQFVRARVIWNSNPSVLVPTTAVTRIAGQPFVFVLEQEQGQNGQPQQIARQRPVKLGNLQGNNYQVLEGVSSGEQLVVSGLLNLQDGAPVQVVPAASPAQ